jgi:hypothetical protein
MGGLSPARGCSRIETKPERANVAEKKASERRNRGFERAASLLQSRIRKAGEARGFGAARLLTHWAEIVGEETARFAQPIKLHHARGEAGLGGTLTLLAKGAAGPLLQMRLPEIRAKVNAALGYAAIAEVRIAQTAPTGFAEKPAAFRAAPKALAPETEGRAREAAAPIADPGLRAALEALGRNVLSKAPNPKT